MFDNMRIIKMVAMMLFILASLGLPSHLIAEIAAPSWATR